MPDHPQLVLAKCPACGERRFRAERQAPEPGDILTCEACGLKLSYAFLSSRIEQAPPAAPERRPVKATPVRRKKAKRKRREPNGR